MAKTRAWVVHGIRKSDFVWHAETAEQGKKAVEKGDLPARVPCLCNGLRGEFDIAKACVILEGRECTPTEFERLAGKASSKKWKVSALMPR